jgi:hypothetical protein
VKITDANMTTTSSLFLALKSAASPTSQTYSVTIFSGGASVTSNTSATTWYYGVFY